MASSSPKDWSLFEHVAFLLERWYLPVLGAVLCGAVAYGAAALLTTREVATGTLRIGTAYSVGLLAKPADVAVRISSPAFLGSLVASHPQDFPRGRRGLRLTAVAPESTDLVSLTAVAPTAAEARAVVRLAGRRIARTHAKISDRIRELTEEQLTSMKRDVASLSAQIKSLAQAPAHADATARAFREARRETLISQLYRLHHRLDAYQLGVDPAINPATALVDGPAVGRHSARRKVAVLGALCGAILGVFLAYFLAFQRRRRLAGTAGERAVTPVPDERAAGAP